MEMGQVGGGGGRWDCQQDGDLEMGHLQKDGDKTGRDADVLNHNKSKRVKMTLLMDVCGELVFSMNKSMLSRRLVRANEANAEKDPCDLLLTHTDSSRFTDLLIRFHI